MCSRFENAGPPLELLGRFGLSVPPEAVPDEVRPTDPALVILPGPRAAVLRWGIEVSWDRRPVINARLEEIERKATFAPHLRSRCLVPATAWFEWRKEGRARLRHRFSLPGGEPFALAGLACGGRFVILTCAAAPQVLGVHDRMPVVLPAPLEAPWIDAAVPFTRLAALLGPWTGGLVVQGGDGPPGLFG